MSRNNDILIHICYLKMLKMFFVVLIAFAECKSINTAVGDFYWNHYTNQSLSGYANERLYENLEIAQQVCMQLSGICAGVTTESTGYRLRRDLFFTYAADTETWVKGQIWAANFVPRNAWAARDAKDLDNFPLPAEVGVIGHHTAGTECFNLQDCIAVMKGIQDFHMDDRDWWDIGYNFLIGQDGRIYEGRGFTVQGAHCSGWNTVTLGK